MNQVAPRLEPVALGELSEQPLVSILTANRNYGDFVCQAIESVVAQDYRNLEMIVCDDGSSDDSIRRIEPYVSVDQRVKLIRKPNGGQASAWNLGYLHSAGEIICILDADDLFVPEKVGKIVEAFRNDPTAGLIIHPMKVVDGTGRVIRQVPFKNNFESGWIAEKVIRRGGRWKSMFGSALCFRRELGQLIFPIPEDLFRGYADAFIFRIAPLLTPVGSTQEPLSLYRFHGNNLTAVDRLDVESLERRHARNRLVEESINARLTEAGFGDRRIEGSSSETDYLIALLGPSSLLSRLRLLMRLVQMVIRDDLDTRVHKVIRLGIYCSALVLPMKARRSLLAMVFSPMGAAFTPHSFRFWADKGMRALLRRMRALRRGGGHGIIGSR